MKFYYPYLLQKNRFLASKTLLFHSNTWERTFSSTLNIMILQMVRNNCVRFGEHIDMEGSYKILQLEVLKEAPILGTSPYFP